MICGNVTGCPIVTDGEPISVKFVPSRLYANCELTPGDAAKVLVPFIRASIVEILNDRPGTVVRVIWK